MRAFDFQTGASFTGDFLDVSKNTIVDNSGGSITIPINPASSNNGGDTSGWFPNITGTVYAADRATDLEVKTVKVLVNGVDNGFTDDTDTDGKYDISGVSSNAGDVITVFIEGEAENGAHVTISNGTGMSLDIYEDHFIVGSKDGSTINNDELYTGGDLAGGDLGPYADLTPLYDVSGALNGNFKHFNGNHSLCFRNRRVRTRCW